ncbi:MAG: type IV secretion system DNA-binding domain-containing protein [Patescibacteria group bacterium]|nr:type IV secretion system DNA-binding domain-containing protein [Patescibacteria group bacterium]
MNTPIDFATIAYEVVRYLIYILILSGWIFGIYLVLKAYSKRRKRLWITKQKYTTILVRVPRNNEKGPLSAQLMFASLHGIYKSAREKLEEGSFQEHLSFEIVSTDKYIRFYIFAPVHLKDFVTGQVYAQYPNVDISEAGDYTLEKRKEGSHFVGTELSLIRRDFFPIKTFLNFEVDPLASITGVLSQLDEGEQIWIQMLARPVSDKWQNKAIHYINNIKSGKRVPDAAIGIFKIFYYIFLFLKLVFAPEPSVGSKGATAVKLSGPMEQAVKAIEEKSTKLGYEAKIRLMFLSSKSNEAMKIKVQSIVGAFKQYNASNLNGFINRGYYHDDYEFLNAFQTRNFEEDGYILNIEELASLYHLPTITVETPTIDWSGSKKGEPPATLPIEGEVPAEELTVFGQTNFRDKITNFGIKMKDRVQHMYIIGQTGTGKSTVMKIQALDDIREGRGLAIIDPHGEFIDTILDYIPENRIKDVVILNPGDREFCPGFNLLENVDENKRDLIASSLMSIFTKIWPGVWSARMEHILKNTILALLETPGTTLLSASKMLVNKEYRKMIIDNVKDVSVREFWIEEFEAQVKASPKFLVEAIAPIQNKIGQFLSVPSIRNMVGQPKSTIDFKDITDNGKILLVKISKGEVGEDNMRLLGAMIITKIYLTIMERAGRRDEEMKPFYLYVDEFQNFATSSFASILSESRKYKLNLIIAHQYIAQLDPDIRDSVLGNAGNIIAFRVGPDDPPTLKKIFEPVFDENDLLNLSTFQIYVKMMIDNTVYPAFSATTIKFWEYFKEKYNLGQKIIDESRMKYAIPRADVEQAILTWSESIAQNSLNPVRGGERGSFSPDTPGQAQEFIPVKKSGEGYREVKGKEGGVWYIRKSQKSPQSNVASQFDGVKIKNEEEPVGAQNFAPENVAENVSSESISPIEENVGARFIAPDQETIKDIPIGEGVAEDLVFPVGEEDDNVIKPGESVEL